MQYFWCLLFTFLLLLLFIFAEWRRSKNLYFLFSKTAFSRLSLALSGRRQIYYLLSSFAMLILFLSLWLRDGSAGKGLNIQANTSARVLFLWDVSLSMMSKDVSPSRLEKTRLEIKKIIHKMPGASFALIPFAGEAFIQCPFTNDINIFQQYLDIISGSTLPVPGSNLGTGLNLAVKLFDKINKNNIKGKKILLVFTDGADLTIDEKVYEKLVQRKIQVYIYGMGGNNLVPIEMVNYYRDTKKFKKDINGKEVKTRMEKRTLIKIAKKMKGQFISNITDLPSIATVSNNKKSKEIETLKGEVFFKYVIFPVFLLVLAILIRETRLLKQRWKGRFEE